MAKPPHSVDPVRRRGVPRPQPGAEVPASEPAPGSDEIDEQGLLEPGATHDGVTSRAASGDRWDVAEVFEEEVERLGHSGGEAVPEPETRVPAPKTPRAESLGALQKGDPDLDWLDATMVGEEAPGGGNPTPDQDVVEELGEAVGVTYQDEEELSPEEKLVRRDDRRWELDPASSEDYPRRP